MHINIFKIIINCARITNKYIKHYLNKLKLCCVQHKRPLSIITPDVFHKIQVYNDLLQNNFHIINKQNVLFPIKILSSIKNISETSLTKYVKPLYMRSFSDTFISVQNYNAFKVYSLNQKTSFFYNLSSGDKINTFPSHLKYVVNPFGTLEFSKFKSFNKTDGRCQSNSTGNLLQKKIHHKVLKENCIPIKDNFHKKFKENLLVYSILNETKFKQKMVKEIYDYNVSIKKKTMDQQKNDKVHKVIFSNSNIDQPICQMNSVNMKEYEKIYITKKINTNYDENKSKKHILNKYYSLKRKTPITFDIEKFTKSLDNAHKKYIQNLQNNQFEKSTSSFTQTVISDGIYFSLGSNINSHKKNQYLISNNKLTPSNTEKYNNIPCLYSEIKQANNNAYNQLSNKNVGTCLYGKLINELVSKQSITNHCYQSKSNINKKIINNGSTTINAALANYNTINNFIASYKSNEKDKEKENCNQFMETTNINSHVSKINRSKIYYESCFTLPSNNSLNIKMHKIKLKNIINGPVPINYKIVRESQTLTSNIKTFKAFNLVYKKSNWKKSIILKTKLNILPSSINCNCKFTYNIFNAAKIYNPLINSKMYIQDMKKFNKQLYDNSNAQDLYNADNVKYKESNFKKIFNVWNVSVTENSNYIWPYLNQIYAYALLPSIMSLAAKSTTLFTRRGKKSELKVNTEAFNQYEIYWKLQSYLRPISSQQEILEILYPGVATQNAITSIDLSNEKFEPALKNLDPLEIMLNKPKRLEMDEPNDFQKIQELITEVEASKTKSILTFDKFVSTDLSEKSIPEIDQRKYFLYEILMHYEQYCACKKPCPCKIHEFKWRKIKRNYNHTPFHRTLPRIFDNFDKSNENYSKLSNIVINKPDNAIKLRELYKNSKLRESSSFSIYNSEIKLDTLIYNKVSKNFNIDENIIVHNTIQYSKQIINRRVLENKFLPSRFHCVLPKFKPNRRIEKQNGYDKKRNKYVTVVNTPSKINRNKNRQTLNSCNTGTHFFEESIIWPNIKDLCPIFKNLPNPNQYINGSEHTMNQQFNKNGRLNNTKIPCMTLARHATKEKYAISKSVKPSNKGINLKVIPRPGGSVFAEIVGKNKDFTEILLTETVPESLDLNSIKPLELILSIDEKTFDTIAKKNMSHILKNKNTKKKKIVEVFIEKLNDNGKEENELVYNVSKADSIEKMVEQIVYKKSKCSNPLLSKSEFTTIRKSDQSIPFNSISIYHAEDNINPFQHKTIPKIKKIIVPCNVNQPNKYKIMNKNNIMLSNKASTSQKRKEKQPLIIFKVENNSHTKDSNTNVIFSENKLKFSPLCTNHSKVKVGQGDTKQSDQNNDLRETLGNCISEVLENLSSKKTFIKDINSTTSNISEKSRQEALQLFKKNFIDFTEKIKQQKNLKRTSKIIKEDKLVKRETKQYLVKIIKKIIKQMEQYQQLILNVDPSDDDLLNKNRLIHCGTNYSYTNNRSMLTNTDKISKDNKVVSVASRDFCMTDRPIIKCYQKASSFPYQVCFQ